MDNITLGQIKDIVLYVGTFIGGIGVLYKLLMAGIGKLLQPIKDDLKEEKKARLKSELTTFMYLAENGSLSPEQKILAHEDYDVYTNKLKCNSYIHNKWENLEKEGKI